MLEYSHEQNGKQLIKILMKAVRICPTYNEVSVALFEECKKIGNPGLFFEFWNSLAASVEDPRKTIIYLRLLQYHSEMHSGYKELLNCFGSIDPEKLNYRQISGVQEAVQRGLDGTDEMAVDDCM
jgi:hypothetical protein